MKLFPLYLTINDYSELFEIYGLTGKETFNELYQLHSSLEKNIDTGGHTLSEAMYLVDKANFVQKAFWSFPFEVRVNFNEEELIK